MAAFQFQPTCYFVSGAFSAFRSLHQGSINIHCSKWGFRQVNYGLVAEDLFSEDDFCSGGNLYTPNDTFTGGAFCSSAPHAETDAQAQGEVQNNTPSFEGLVKKRVPVGKILPLPKPKAKAVPLHTMKALGGRGDIAPTHSRPRH
jgi:hypothetical protein